MLMRVRELLHKTIHCGQPHSDSATSPAGALAWTDLHRSVYTMVSELAGHCAVLSEPEAERAVLTVTKIRPM